MVGPGFIDKSDEFVVTRSNTVTVSAQLSLSLLERLRERFSTDRALCKLFLQLIRVAVNDFLMQLPRRSRASTQATKYLPMTPVEVTHVAIKYTDVDDVHTVIAPVLTNTGDVDPVKFLGLICYMVHMKDAAYMWLVEEICSGAQMPPSGKSKSAAAAAAARRSPGASGGAAGSGNGGSAAGTAANNATAGAAGTGGHTPAGGSAGTGDNTPASGAAGTGGNTPAAGEVGTGANTPVAGAAGIGDISRAARASRPGGGTPSAGAAGTGSSTPAAPTTATASSTPANSAAGRGGIPPAGGTAGTGDNTAAAGVAGTGDNTPAAGAAETGDNTTASGAARTGDNTPAAGAAGTGGNSLTAVAAGVGGNTRVAAIGAGGTPSEGASVALAVDATQLVGHARQQRGDPLPSLSPHPQRSSLFVDSLLVGSGVLLPMRSHCGRDPVARHLIVTCQVKVLDNHKGDENGFVVAPGHGTATVPLTFGTAAQSGREFLWKASCIG